MLSGFCPQDALATFDFLNDSRNSTVSKPEYESLVEDEIQQPDLELTEHQLIEQRCYIHVFAQTHVVHQNTKLY